MKRRNFLMRYFLGRPIKINALNSIECWHIWEGKKRSFFITIIKIKLSMTKNIFKLFKTCSDVSLQ